MKKKHMYSNRLDNQERNTKSGGRKGLKGSGGVKKTHFADFLLCTE